MTDLFQPEGTTPEVDVNKDYLSELVGEGKKFKTVQDLARGKYQSDIHIDLLEKTKDQLRADYLKLSEDAQAQATLKDLVTQLKAPNQQPASSITPQANVDNQRPSIDQKDLESLVDSRMNERELSRKQSDNFKVVQDRLKERFGSNYQTVLKQQIDDLQLTSDYVNDLARRSPEAFFRTMGLNNEQPRNDSFQPPARSSLRVDSLTQKADIKEEGSWAWYQNLKETNPKLYLDPKTVVQMEKDYQRLGKKFENGDFLKLQRSAF